MPQALQALNNGVPISWYLILSAVLFALGVAGFMFRRSIITVFMSIELMLNAVNLSFATFANYWSTHPAPSGQTVLPLSGHIFVFFVMVVAAAEAAVGLAIIISVFRTRETLNVDRVNLLKL
jgi:NADH-quinone oxidoreductase subunit K